MWGHKLYTLRECLLLFKTVGFSDLFDVFLCKKPENYHMKTHCKCSKNTCSYGQYKAGSLNKTGPGTVKNSIKALSFRGLVRVDTKLNPTHTVQTHQPLRVWGPSSIIKKHGPEGQIGNEWL